MTYILFLVFIFALGLIVGSFLSAYTYRCTNDKSVKDGRSFCDRCKKTINWFDNIPLLSFILLKGKCRYCGEKISSRYPLIEFTTAFLFLLIAMLIGNCAIAPRSNDLCRFYGIFGTYALPFLLIIVSYLVAIFVIDFENKLILDEVVFSLFAISFLVFILFSNQSIFVRMLTGSGATLFLLVIHLITKGRGMGLGDVKFAIAGGFILGWPDTIIWLYSSFIIGAIVGIILILNKKAKFGKHIAFGPFLVIGFVITLLWGDLLFNSLFPPGLRMIK